MKHLKFLAIFSVILTFSCQREIVPENVRSHYDLGLIVDLKPSKNLILGYVDVKGLGIDDNLYKEKRIFRFPIFFEKYNIFYSKNLYYYPTNTGRKDKISDKENEDFLTLAKKNNDENFNRNITYALNLASVGAEGNNVSTAQNFTSISIKSDADFDEKHPAGAELGDLVYFVGHSFSPYLESGYKEIKNDTIPAEMGELKKFVSQEKLTIIDSELVQNPALSFVCRKCSELTPAILKKMQVVPYPSIYDENYFGELYFPIMPSKEKIHKLTITLTTDEEERSYSCNYLLAF